MAYRFGKRSKKNLEGLHPDMVKVMHKALELGVMDFTITDGVRTLEQQKELYAQGRTKPGKIVTWTLKSNHLVQDTGYGHAVDIAPYPIDYDDEARFHQLAGVVKAAANMLDIKLDWGYDLWGKDLPHFQLKG